MLGVIWFTWNKHNKLPDNLYVGIDLFIYNTPLANKYTDEEIREMVDQKVEQ
jgi:hypothetical protein